MLETALKILVFGAVTSGIYALMALGITVVYGIGRVVNFAQGAFYMLGAYFTFISLQYLEIGLIPSALIGVIGVALLAMIIDRLLINPVRENEVVVWMLTLATALAIRQAIIITVGPRPYSLPHFLKGSTTLGSITLSSQRILIIIASAIVVALVWFILHHSNFGKALRAVAQNRDAAYLMGINVEKMYVASLGISGALAAIAGILISPLSNMLPDMGWTPLLYGITIVVIGGLGSVKGSLLAAILVGYASTVVSFLITPLLVTFIVLCIVFTLLVFRPEGLFGVEAEAE